MRYVIYQEPWPCGPELNDYVEVKKVVTEEAAIRLQKWAAFNSNKKYIYETDQQALDDFIVVNWAYIRDIDGI